MPCRDCRGCVLILSIFLCVISAHLAPAASLIMKRSFAVMTMSLSVVMPAPPIAAASCIYFEAMPCAEVTQISGNCQLEDLISNDALGEYGCCVDPLPNSCNCFVGGLLLADIDDKCGAGPCHGVGNSGSNKCNDQVMEIQTNKHNAQTIASPMAEVLSSSTRATSIVKEASAAATLPVPKGLCMTTVALSLLPFLL